MEVTVVGQNQWEEIHRRKDTGQSLSAIARELGLDRKTVRASDLEDVLSQVETGGRSIHFRAPPVAGSAEANREMSHQPAHDGARQKWEESIPSLQRTLDATAQIAFVREHRG